MSDDLWQKELAQANREHQEDQRRRLDERWDRLSTGELSPEEEAELRALAATSAEASQAWEAFRPLGAGFQAGVVQAIRDQGLAEPVAPANPGAPARLLPFRRRTFALGLGSAVAAALLVLVLLPEAPLPDYQATLTGGVRTMRSQEPVAVEVFAPGSAFHVLLRPGTQSPGKKLEAQCYLVRGQERHRLEIRSEIDPGGSVQVDGVIRRDVPPGTWTLWTLVGRQGKLPDPDALASLSPSPGARERNWIAAGTTIRVQPRTSVPNGSGKGLEDSVEN